MNLGWDKEKIEEFINNDKPVVIIDEEYFKENYISKDKIIDNIKELEKMKNAFPNDDWKREFNFRIETLEKLLEEEL